MDISPELRPFMKLYDNLAYRHNYSTILDDFVTMALNTFTIDKCLEEQTKFLLSKYNEDEKQILNRMYLEMLNVYRNMVNTSFGWYDFFGNLYMFIASSKKQSSLGQFFTPESVVDMCVKIQGSDDLIGKKLNISDPACGSGRFLIAFHASYPGNNVYGEDLDPLCAKMTAINMLLHGCEGEVVCHDSILCDYNFGYKINPYIHQLGFPNITGLREEESFIMKIFKQKEVEKDTIKQQPIIITKPEQLTLFAEGA